ncbi:hypothetical protein GLOIN_2v1502209 [Rhizophagus irregularis DAOM 181602=DAOM 197198]|nr:hypothetical protein GLOIN_2v1502209 [Rhizophagus irregularis DAOM 181602=DAOM 197198]
MSPPFFGGDFCGGSYVDREFLKLRDQNDFDSFEFNIEEIFPVLNQYCKDEIKEKMEKWIIDINFEDLKSMFDLNILVGGLSESKYFFSRSTRFTPKNLSITALYID